MILALYRKGELKKTELYSFVTKNSLNPRKLSELENAGLISLKYSRFDNNTTVAKLTDLGQAVAVKLISIENLINGKDTDPVVRESTPADHRSAAVSETLPAPQPPRRLLDPNLSLVLRMVYERQHSTFPELLKYTKLADAELRSNLDVLVSSGWVRTAGDRYLVTEEGAKKARLVIALENGQDVVETDHEEPAAGGAETKGRI
ncbi:MAG: hypothetical protein PHF83_06595 [Candidatus Methanomethylophilus sp.]|nr:hypothetical protein [Methanomethylophilus sp.]